MDRKKKEKRERKEKKENSGLQDSAEHRKRRQHKQGFVSLKLPLKKAISHSVISREYKCCTVIMCTLG